jgi:hypothetical protein
LLPLKSGFVERFIAANILPENRVIPKKRIRTH